MRTQATPHMSDPFLDQGHARVVALRDAILSTLVSVGADIEEPQEISRRFGLDKTLAWKISRLVTESDALVSVVHAPRLPGLQLFERAMAKHNAAPRSLVLLREAIERFETFVTENAGDRDVMEIIITSTNERANAKRLEQFRKDGFVANSATWGVSAKTHYALRMMLPARGQPDMIDMITVTGLLDFRRLRSDVPWTVSTLSQWQLDSELRPDAIFPLEPGAEIPFASDFCSKPLPPMQAIPEGKDKTRFVLDPGPVGNAAAADVMLAWVHFATASKRTMVPGEKGEHGVLLTTPAEVMIHDLFIHESFDFAMSPESKTYSMMPNGPGYPGNALGPQVLPVPTDIIEVDALSHTSEVVCFAPLMQSLMNRFNADASKFRGFRVKVKYPPIPAMHVFRHDLLEG